MTDHPGKAALAAIVERLDGVTRGPWFSDGEISGGGNGNFRAYAIYGPNLSYGSPASICDTHNAGEILIKNDWEEDMPRDEQGRVNMDHIARCDPDTMRAIAAYAAELEARLGAIEKIAQEAADTAVALHEEAHHG